MRSIISLRVMVPKIRLFIVDHLRQGTKRCSKILQEVGRASIYRYTCILRCFGALYLDHVWIYIYYIHEYIYYCVKRVLYCSTVVRCTTLKKM
jgi:hypothetical protein